jgi:hypothetical protein
MTKLPLNPDRRNLLKLGAATAAGAATLVSATTPSLPQSRSGRTMNLDNLDEGGRRATSLERRRNPILYWNDVALQLVALDHSVDARDSRAPGPCATARALGLVHVVMADAVAAVYHTDYEGLLVRDNIPVRAAPEAFVGGAAAWILEHIYSTPAHSYLIGSHRLRFLDSFEATALASWEAGLSFARNEAFTSQWDWPSIRNALLTTPTTYIPRPRGHNVDPFNADQGFYGVAWGRYTPLDPSFGNPASYGPPEPPREGDTEYERDFEEVRRLGALRSDGPTTDQIRLGLFWAYDGARLIGTPPRLFNQIIRQIIVDDDMSLPEMARCLAICNLAMADGGIVAWEAKYRYSVWRPVVAIQHALRGREASWRPFGSPRTNPTQFALGRDAQFRATAQTFMGATVNPLPEPASRTLDYKLAAFTPNFPAYPSGHATLGTACFAALKLLRAERDRTRGNPDRLNPQIDFVSDELNGVSIDHLSNRPRPYLPQNYSSIDQMIEDNVRSRVHLGVHWHFDCEHGSTSGARVAERIYQDAYPRRRASSPVAATRPRTQRAGYRR